MNRRTLLTLVAALTALASAVSYNIAQEPETALAKEKRATQPGADLDEQFKVMELLHADASEAQKIIHELMADSQVRSAVDRRTNALFLRGRADDLAVIEAMVLRLDEPHQHVAQTTTANQEAEVRSPARGEATVVSVAAENAKVKKGDIVLKLDSAPLQLKLRKAEAELAHLQSLEAESQVRTAELNAERMRAENVFQQAKMELEAFKQGEQPLIAKRHEAEIEKAKEALALAQAKVASPEREFQIKKAKTALDLAKMQKQVFDNFTAPKELTSLEAQIHNAEQHVVLAKMRQDANSNNIKAEREAMSVDRQQRLHLMERLKKELQNYEVKAPRSGTVRMPQPIREGDVVRQGQTILLITGDDAGN